MAGSVIVDVRCRTLPYTRDRKNQILLANLKIEFGCALAEINDVASQHPLLNADS
jgi:hypothetical protein